MKIIDLKKNIEVEKADGPLCLLLGNFDGVHRGHVYLATLALAEGAKNGLKVGVWTFADHPMDTLSGRKNAYLTSMEEKNEIFASLGVDYMIYEDFSAVRFCGPDEFAQRVLIDGLDCRFAVCGFNFRFGKDGQGNAESLKDIFESRGRCVTVADAVSLKDTVVSSTVVRSMIEEGNTEGASELLGRPYSVTLPVEYGKQLGRTMGLPTINQRFPENRVRPKCGIYACTCLVDGQTYKGVANVGSRPTVNGDEGDVNCETHIIDYNGWLYGKMVKVSFYGRLRDEKRFEGVDELKSAITGDVIAAREYFSKKGL